jgi:hypothetical protein
MSMFPITVPAVLELAQFSPNWEASWLFRSAPLCDHDELLRGAIKGLLSAWLLPIACLTALVLAVFQGPESLPAVLLAVVMLVFVTLSIARRFEIGLPFTQRLRSGGFNHKNLALVLGLMLVVMLSSGVHFSLCLHWSSTSAGILFFAWASSRVLRSFERLRVPRAYAMLPE